MPPLSSDRVGEVDRAVVQYRADMEAYFEGLAGVDDPARLATMAEAMPEPPALDALADLGDHERLGVRAGRDRGPEPEQLPKPKPRPLPRPKPRPRSR